jgi:molecular chaperone GrpE (heat shock protein)
VNDLWIGIGGNSEHAQSPKYRELPLNVLSQVGPQESSRGSSSRPVAELGSDTLNPSKFATGRSRSNNKRIDDESDDLEELRVQLRRKELDFEKLSNEFDHCRSRWEIEKEDIERQRDQALAANKYV